MVFETSAAPRGRKEFMEWYNEQTEWNEDHSYDDHSVSSKALQNFFLEFIEHFPPLNGPLKSSDIDNPKITDHCIGKNVIYSGFRFSEAEEAFETMRFLSVKHSVGFFDVSSDKGELLFPGDEDVIQHLELDEIESRIIPIIQAANTLNNSTTPVKTAFLADLNISYGIDNGDSFQLLFDHHLPDDYNYSSIKNMAVGNLKKLVINDIQMGQTENGLYAFQSKRCFSSTILLVDDVWKFAKNQIKDDAIIGIPSIEWILFAPASDKKLIEQLKKLSSQIYENEENVLTDKLFKNDGRSLSLF